jgi:hypothetical protein
MTYQLYTDASKKNEYAIMAGVILGEKNRPVCEFIIHSDINISTDMLERKAMFVGMEIALEAGIEKLVIHSDNLNNVNIFLGKNKNPKEKISENEITIINSFKSIDFKYVSRNMNLYANALTNLPHNIKYLGNVMSGYHGVNRAKNRFYSRLKIGIHEDKKTNPQQKKTKASVYTKLKTSKEILEHMSRQDNYNDKDMKRINKMFTQMFLCFSEILIQKQSAIKDFNGAFYYFLENTKIKSSLYPDWVEKSKTEEKIKFIL